MVSTEAGEQNQMWSVDTRPSVWQPSQSKCLRAFNGAALPVHTSTTRVIYARASCFTRRTYVQYYDFQGLNFKDCACAFLLKCCLFCYKYTNYWILTNVESRSWFVPAPITFWGFDGNSWPASVTFVIPAIWYSHPLRAAPTSLFTQLFMSLFVWTTVGNTRWRCALLCPHLTHNCISLFLFLAINMTINMWSGDMPCKQFFDYLSPFD